MATKVERIEARLTGIERRQIEQAAALIGESVSAFMVLAALERADVEQATTVVPANYFDLFVASLDAPDEAPSLARAASAARRRRQITAA
ncbi:MAG: hypothetical protein QOH12_990 [Solirubrobacteraceae bacterium]|jgi:uncharacterized protein (DUF1778 family)|nr:hypothetical protein [Solirubrobacteraceae bacterium]